MGPQFVERLSRVLGLSFGVMKTMTFAKKQADFIWYFQVTLYPSLRESQDRNGSRTMKECNLLDRSPWLAQPVSFYHPV